MLVLLLAAAAADAQQPGARADTRWARDLGFRHSTHRVVECPACHASEERPEQLRLAHLQDCQSCHHQPPLAADCMHCDARDDARAITRQVTRTLDIRLASLDRPQRVLPFRHTSHAGTRCRTCHTAGLALSAADVDCTMCHEAHHLPTARCLACHEPPAAGAHDREVHVGCGGAACHERAPSGIQTVPRTRAFCLACHSAMAYHRPEESCPSCHVLPPPRTPGG